MGSRLTAGLTAALLAAALLVAALDSAPVPSGAAAPAAPSTLDVSIPGAFGGCDPGKPSTTAATDAVLALVLPSAFTPGTEDVAVGDTNVIAEAELVAPSPQAVVYTIAPGVTWPSGRPFVAADLVRTWLERRHDHVLADLGYRDVASMVPGPAGTTVTVRFRAPYSDWASLFDLVVPGPTASARCLLPTAALDPSIGPYAIVASTPTRITLEANPLWPDPPTFPRVIVSTDPGAPRASSSSTPAVDYLPDPSVGALQAITSTGAYSSVVAHTTTVVSLDFAVHGPAALSLDARRGVAALVDRTAIVDDLAAPVDPTAAPAASELFGQADPEYLGPAGTGVASPVPATAAPGVTGPSAYSDDAEPAAAAGWLRAAGLSRVHEAWGTPGRGSLTVCLAVPSGDAVLRTVARVLHAQLGAAGVGLVPQLVHTDADVVEALRAGRCAAGLVIRSGDGYPTHAVASWLRPSAPIPAGLTWTGVSDPVVASSAATATAVLNPVTATTAWAATDARLWTLMAGLPLYSPSAYVGWSLSVAGMTACDTTAGCIGEIPSLVFISPRP